MNVNICPDWQTDMYHHPDLCCCVMFAFFEDSLKLKLDSETRRNASQKDRIHQLQNQLIRVTGEHTHIRNLISVSLGFRCVHSFPWCHTETGQWEETDEVAESSAATAWGEPAAPGEDCGFGSYSETAEGGEELLVHKQAVQTHPRSLPYLQYITKSAVQTVLAAENARLREELDRKLQQPAAVNTQPLEQVRIIPKRFYKVYRIFKKSLVEIHSLWEQSPR